MALLKHLLIVVMVSVFCASLMLVAFSWADPETRRTAAIVAAVGSTVGLSVLRRHEVLGPDAASEADEPGA